MNEAMRAKLAAIVAATAASVPEVAYDVPSIRPAPRVARTFSPSAWRKRRKAVKQQKQSRSRNRR